MEHAIVEPQKRLTASETRTYALSLLGYPATEIGRLEGISDRQVRNRIAKAKKVTGLPDVLASSVVELHRLVPKAISVLNRYLDGIGSQDGGDLKAAVRILESAGVLKAKAPASVKVEQNTTLNQTKVENRLEQYFAGKSEEEIRAEIEASEKRMLKYLQEKWGSSSSNAVCIESH